MLSAPAITELDVESSTYALFAEWLAKYFDGQPHAVGGNAAVPFPKAVIQFGQSPMAQPLNPSAVPQAQSPAPQASIVMVWGSPVSTVKRWENSPLGPTGTVQMVYKKVRWNFWVRAELQASDSGNARKLCRQTGERLNALLTNPATAYELAEKGIHHARPAEPEPVADTGFILMLVTCRATLRYPVLGGEPQVQSVIDAGTPPNVAPTARMNHGVFEIWDAGQQAYVPVTVNNGALGVGAADQP